MLRLDQHCLHLEDPDLAFLDQTGATQGLAQRQAATALPGSSLEMQMIRI